MKPHILFVTDANYVSLAKDCIRTFGATNPEYDGTVVAIDVTDAQAKELRASSVGFKSFDVKKDTLGGVGSPDGVTSNKKNYAAACRPWHIAALFEHRTPPAAILYFDVDYEFYDSIAGLVEDGQLADWMIRSCITIDKADATPDELKRGWIQKNGTVESDEWRGVGKLDLNSGLVWVKNTALNRDVIIPEWCKYIERGNWAWFTDQHGLRDVLQQHLDEIAWRPVDRKHYPAFKHFKGPSKKKN